MECYKTDEHRESDCPFAKFSPLAVCAECTNQCVIEADKVCREAMAAKRSAEWKLRQYREAVQPIAANCRAIIDLWEAEAKAEEKAEKEKQAVAPGPRETLLEIANEMVRGQGTLSEFAERILVACKRAYNAIDAAVCGIDAASNADVNAVRKAADETIGDFGE